MSTSKPDQAIGARMHALCAELYPYVRSITGNGVRRTLKALQGLLPLEIHEVPSGRPVFDWTVPPEWNIERAYIADAKGRRVVDLSDHSLHVMSYSEPVHRHMTLEELQPHLHSIPEHPDWIPYRTSYFSRAWAFCLKHSQRQKLEPGTYEVLIDSSLKPGSLTYGEYVVPGTSEREILVWAHVCHPSLANDNLSGIAVATFLANHCARAFDRPRYTYRFVFAPSTVGAITWLALNEARIPNIHAGLVISGVGDSGPFTYKKSRNGNSSVDALVETKLRQRKLAHSVQEFSPYGYDERQFCSPGINLGVGCLMRTPFGQYPQYHTSADDLGFISAANLQETFELCADVLQGFECIGSFRNLAPKCEPQLGRRGLYEALGGENDKRVAQLALLWMLSYSDGNHSTLDISRISGLDIEVLYRAALRLHQADLLAYV